MKRIIMLSIISMFLLSFSFPQISHASDIEQHWAKDDIQELVNRNIMGGYGNGIFLPNNNITRAEFTQLVLNSLGISAGNHQSPFKDVQKGDWYYSSVVTAAKLGLVSGTSATTFSPEKPITRQDISVMITRALSMKNINSIESRDPFLDDHNISAYAKPSVKRLQYLGIVAGKTKAANNQFYFKPFDRATRAEAAVMLVRMLKAIEQPSEVTRSTTYNYNFSQMVDKQMAITGTARPKTDIAATWYEGSRKMVEHYANPKNFKYGTNGFYQFLVLSGNAGLSETQLNDVLDDGGVLKNKGKAFLNASQTYGVNEMYLIAHAYLETGRGTSSLATGQNQVGLNSAGKAVLVTASNKDQLTNIKPVFNLFGIKANDSCPETCGSIHAYNEGWFSVEKAIDGGAKFIAGNYFANGQDTLYKMRWNPNKPGSHQYATDVAWAVKQTNRMRNMLDELYGKSDQAIKVFDVPKFSNTPAQTALPTGEAIFRIDSLHPSVGKLAKTTAKEGVNFRTVPTTSATFGDTVIRKLPLDTEVVITAENTNWYKVKADDTTGWISGDYLNIPNTKDTDPLDNPYTVSSTPEIIIGKVIDANISLKQAADASSTTLRELPIGAQVNLLKEENGWFHISFDNQTGWIPVDAITITNLAEIN